jgi:WNK lysine deficient protein kinase
MDVEHKCDDYESRARLAEVRYREAIWTLGELEEQQNQQRYNSNDTEDHHDTTYSSVPINIDRQMNGNLAFSPPPSSSASSSSTTTATSVSSSYALPSAPIAVPNHPFTAATRSPNLNVDTSKHQEAPSIGTTHHDDQSGLLPTDEQRKSDENNSAMREALFSHILEGKIQTNAEFMSA